MARSLAGCGCNNIDARVAEEAVYAAMARLSDPRRAERVAAHLAQVRAERSQIAGEIAQWQATAVELAEKTAGVWPALRRRWRRFSPRSRSSASNSPSSMGPRPRPHGYRRRARGEYFECSTCLIGDIAHSNSLTDRI
jgi:hypothetical protein